MQAKYFHYTDNCFSLYWQLIVIILTFDFPNAVSFLSLYWQFWAPYSKLRNVTVTIFVSMRVRPSVSPSLHPHGTTWHTLKWFSLNFKIWTFIKTCRYNQILANIILKTGNVGWVSLVPVTCHVFSAAEKMLRCTEKWDHTRVAKCSLSASRKKWDNSTYGSDNLD